MSEQCEITWLLAAQQGDDDAFEALQASLEPPIRRFVRRLTNSDYAEEDIIQDVFIALYFNLRKIDPPEKLRAYVFRIARNRCWDELRQRGRREIYSLDDEATSVWVSFTAAKETDKPDELTHWMLLLLEVQEAMDQLPEPQRQALILYSEMGLSYAEIAEVMGSSVGTIKSRIHHAKARLRRSLRPETLEALETDL